MGFLKQDIDYSRLSGADSFTVKLFNHPVRWFTTVGLQGFLGVFFLLLPGPTMSILWVPDSAHTGAVFQLYGALLLYRAVSEQQVRRRLDPVWCRNYMIATIPFSIGSSVVLTYASIKGLMNYWIGGVWIVMFVLELGEFLYALNRSRNEAGLRVDGGGAA